MELKQADEAVVAKPVASRPTSTKFRSFSELLAGAINTSPPTICSETAVPAIRPKTVRFKPMANLAPAAFFTSQAENSGTAECNSSYNISGADSNSTVIYKPQAKLASKTTVSVLANMGKFNAPQADVHPPSQDKHNVELPFSDVHQNIPCHAETGETAETPRLTSQNQEEDPKALQPVANGDRPSYDGYNWRKYGQKQVKGSEYPRSYYKCTHPNCPVKKKVERSLDGQIAEIVYKGEHNHAKPQPPKRNSSGTQVLGLVNDSNGQDANSSWWNNHLNERNEVSDGTLGNQNGTVLPAHSTYRANAPPSYDPAGIGLVNAGAGTSENSCSLSGECDEGRKGLEGAEDESKSKRRRKENQSLEESVSEGLLPGSIDNEILEDGFRWRKYGQKVVKGNPYPRSYYRCTSLKCNVRKHVERASDDPRAFITTYEGRHNHDMPLKVTNLPANGNSRDRP